MTDHFSDNSELLESYILGRLDPVTAEKCRSHELTCETCRSAVDKERKLAAGIRRAGRVGLKKRIAGEATRARRDPWPAIWSAAAILVVMIGVGISERWFVADQPPAEKPVAQLPAEQSELRGKVGGTRDDARSGEKDILSQPNPKQSARAPRQSDKKEAPERKLALKQDEIAHAPAAQLEVAGDAAGMITNATASTSLTDIRIFFRGESNDKGRALMKEKTSRRTVEAHTDSSGLFVIVQGDSTVPVRARRLNTDSVIVIIGAEELRIPILR